MIPVLLALGATGALLELRRFVHKEGDQSDDASVQVLRENEQRLESLLQVVQRHCCFRTQIAGSMDKRDG